MFHAGAVLLAAAADAGCHVAPHMPRRDVTAVAVAPAAVGGGSAAAIAPVTAGEGSAAGFSSISAERSGDGRVEAGGEGAAAVDGAVYGSGAARGGAGGGTHRSSDGRAGLRVLLEAYPALPARRVLGVGLVRDGDDDSDGRSGGRGGGASTASAWSRGGALCSYKSDSRGKAADPGRAAARKAIYRALVGEVGAAAAAGAAAAVAEGKGAPATRPVGPDDTTAACSAEAGPESVGQPPGATPSRRWRQTCGSGRGRGEDRSEVQSGGSERSPPAPSPAATAGHQASGRLYSGEGGGGGVGGGEAAAGGGARAGGRVAGLAAAYSLESVVMAPEVLQQCEEDASGDTLDAVLAALQAASAATLGPEGNWGAPEEVDPLEGWVTDPWVMEQYQLARNAGINASHEHCQDYFGGSGAAAASGGAGEGATVNPSGQPAAAAGAAVLRENVVVAGISEPSAGAVGVKACGKRRRVAEKQRGGAPGGAVRK